MQEPLNSDDDISDEDQTAEIFDTDNVIVCQFEKVSIISSSFIELAI